MKIEKLSESKIKIILNKEELSINTTKNIEDIFSTQEFNKFFLSVLNKAEKEINFNTNGYKLLVELFYQNNETYSLVVTRYLEADYLKAIAQETHNTNYINENKKQNNIQNSNNILSNNNSNISDNILNNNSNISNNIIDDSTTKKLSKKINKRNNNFKQINIFNTFDDFDNFLDISNLNNTKIKKEFKEFSLYTYNNKYFLITEKRNKAKNLNNKINSALLEFSSRVKYTKNFEIKLQEHGKMIFYT